jgi:hypothetical protein
MSPYCKSGHQDRRGEPNIFTCICVPQKTQLKRPFYHTCDFQMVESLRFGLGAARVRPSSISISACLKNSLQTAIAQTPARSGGRLGADKSAACRRETKSAFLSSGVHKSRSGTSLPNRATTPFITSLCRTISVPSTRSCTQLHAQRDVLTELLFRVNHTQGPF